jgi:hypothetical protein
MIRPQVYKRWHFTSPSFWCLDIGLSQPLALTQRGKIPFLPHGTYASTLGLRLQSSRCQPFLGQSLAHPSPQSHPRFPGIDPHSSQVSRVWRWIGRSTRRLKIYWDVLASVAYRQFCISAPVRHRDTGCVCLFSTCQIFVVVVVAAAVIALLCSALLCWPGRLKAKW